MNSFINFLVASHESNFHLFLFRFILFTAAFQSNSSLFFDLQEFLCNVQNIIIIIIIVVKKWRIEISVLFILNWLTFLNKSFLFSNRFWFIVRIEMWTNFSLILITIIYEDWFWRLVFNWRFSWKLRSNLTCFQILKILSAEKT